MTKRSTANSIRTCASGRRILGGTFAAALGVAAAGSAEATRLYDPSFSTCTTTNCSSISILAPLLNYGANANAPWVAEVWVGPSQCVGFDISSLSDRYVFVTVPPAAGEIDLDAGGSSTPGFDSTDPRFEPLRTSIAAPQGYEGWRPGWFTVAVLPWRRDLWDGAPPTEPAEEMLPISFGRYNIGNPNCAYVEGNPSGKP